MSNFVPVKNILNNQSITSSPPLFSMRHSGPQGGVSGFDDIFSEVKKSLSGQLDAASSGNALPSGALCVIPLSPNINVLTQKNPEFSEDAIRQFAIGDGLNPEMLRLIMEGAGPLAPLESKGMVVALSDGNAALRVALAPAGVDTMQALSQDMARLLIKGAGLGNMGKLDVAPGVRVGLRVTERVAGDVAVKAADMPDITAAEAAGAQGEVRSGVAMLATAMDVLAGGAMGGENNLAASMTVAKTPIQVLKISVGGAAVQVALEHLSVSYTPSPMTVPAAATAMEVLVGGAMGGENNLEASMAVAKTPTQAPTQVLAVSVGGAAVQVALASQQGDSTKIAENGVIAQALAEVALKAGLTERKTVTGLSAERGAIQNRDTFVAMSVGEIPQVMPVGAVWHEEIDLSQFGVPHAGGRDITPVSNGINGDIGGPAITTENAVLQDRLSQQQQYQKRSEQLMDVVGKRISEQVARGVWQMSFQLRPARLGRIDVQLSMSDGAVDASFSATQAGTQELLEGGLDRLKDALEGAGVSVGRLASDAHGNRGGGQQSPSAGESGSQSARLASTPASTLVPLTGAPESRISADSVDLLV